MAVACIPFRAAEIVGEQGKVYALDKDKQVLDELMRKARSAGLKNVERVDALREMEIQMNAIWAIN